MKISKRSWHYKFIMHWHDEVKQTLCLYFWQLVVAIFQLLFVGFIIVIIFPLVIGMFMSLMITDFNLLDNTIPLQKVLYVYLIGISTIIVSSIIVWLLFLISNNRKPLKLQTKVERKPNLFIMFIKNKRNKYCSWLEFTDD